MKRKPKAFINVVSNWVSIFLNIAVGFFLTPFIITNIGKTGFGIWTLIFSIIGYYGVFETALIPAITHYIARYLGQKNQESINETASTAILIFVIIGAAIIIVSFFIAAPIADVMNITEENRDLFIYVIWILGIATGIKFPSSVFGAIINAHEQWVAYNFSIIARVVIRAVMTIVLLLMGMGIQGLAYATLCSIIVEFIFNFIIYKYYAPEITMSFSHIKIKMLRLLLIYSGIMTIIKVSNLIRFNIDSLVIGKMIGLDEIGVYQIATLLVSYSAALIYSAMKVLTPRFSKLFGAGEKEKLKILFIRSLAISTFFSFGVVLLAFTLGARFIYLWVGEGFKDAIPVLWILLTAYSIELAQNPAGGLLKSINKHLVIAIAQIIEAMANLTLSILLAPQYGIMGVALGTAIPMIIVKLFVQPIYITRIMKINIFHYYKSILIHGALVVVLICAAFYTGIIMNEEVLTGINALVYIIIAGIIIGGIYLASSLVIMGREDRTFLLTLIPGIKTRVK